MPILWTHAAHVKISIHAIYAFFLTHTKILQAQATHATHEPTLPTPPTLFSRFNHKGVNIIKFFSISVNFLACIFLVQSLMLELPKIFLIVRFFSWISYNKGLKAKISCFFSCFFCLNPMRQNVLESERPSRSPRHLCWRNTKICIHGASQMEQKRGNCWKLSILVEKLQVFNSYLSKMKTVSML